MLPQDTLMAPILEEKEFQSSELSFTENQRNTLAAIESKDDKLKSLPQSNTEQQVQAPSLPLDVSSPFQNPMILDDKNQDNQLLM